MLAIIPARGGSKRLPGKNIKLLKNKPLIAYTIETALKSKYITKVVVSTDCEEIAKIAMQYGAIVPGLRPNYLASDDSSTNEVVIFTINLIEAKYDYKISSCILLQPTSPLRTVEHINESIELFKEKNADSVISFTKEFHPLVWNKYINQDGTLSGITSLENKPSYFPNGSIYILTKEVISKNNYYTENTYAYVMNRKYSCDIDTQDDWDYAEFLISLDRYNDIK